MLLQKTRTSVIIKINIDVEGLDIRAGSVGHLSSEQSGDSTYVGQSGVNPAPAALAFGYSPQLPCQGRQASEAIYERSLHRWNGVSEPVEPLRPQKSTTYLFACHLFCVPSKSERFDDSFSCQDYLLLL